MTIGSDDIVLNKSAVIERCLRRIQEEYRACPQLDNFTHLDALTLNIERACQASIDLAMHVVAREKLGIPQSNAQAFSLLVAAGIIDEQLGTSLRGMAGFRNISVHSYQDLDQEIIFFVVREGYKDLVALCRAVGVRIHL